MIAANRRINLFRCGFPDTDNLSTFGGIEHGNGITAPVNNFTIDQQFCIHLILP